ncbi:MAG: D-alanyl-D-alanine carboxypeptidase [Citromicrobium sp.]|nr:D-alanyl-D-alanine carboxypeptidase [Citromicrobium sp.]MBD75438.1 D-alanyl-D-alanine carboxypeptidase [Citromicrobium sp.]MBT47104.1 D-alanyl-D-alanine carboxypeptidase [Citromicrobium sp.]
MVKRHRATALVAAMMLALPTNLSAQSSQRPAPPTPEQAPIAYMIDLSSGQTLYARDIDRRFVPASITKVMTTLVAFDMLADGKLRPDQRVPYRDETFKEWHRKGSTLFLPAHARPTVQELLIGITTVSANDASVVLAEGAAGSVKNWADRMNATAHSIGMHDSHFGTPNGWPDEGRTFVTARDLGTLAERILRHHPEKFDFYYGRRGLKAYGIAQDNHDPITGRVEGADGMKTGFTDQAGYGFLGTAERNGRRLVMVVAGADRGSERNRASRAFMEWGFKAFDSRILARKNQPIASARVQNGSLGEVPLVADQDVRVAVPRGDRAKAELTIHYDGPLRAPIAKGEAVATLEIAVPGMEKATLPLYASQEVKEAGMFGRIANGFAGLFG